MRGICAASSELVQADKDGNRDSDLSSVTVNSLYALDVFLIHAHVQYYDHAVLEYDRHVSNLLPYHVNHLCDSRCQVFCLANRYLY